VGRAARGARPFTVLVIFVVTRFAARALSAVLRSAEAGQIRVLGLDSDTVRATRPV
jgi:hypothetical protein